MVVVVVCEDGEKEDKQHLSVWQSVNTQTAF